MKGGKFTCKFKDVIIPEKRLVCTTNTLDLMISAFVCYLFKNIDLNIEDFRG